MTKLISVLLVLGFATVSDAALEPKPGKPSVDTNTTKPRPCVLPKQQLPQSNPLPHCPSGFIGRAIQGSTVIRCNPVLFSDVQESGAHPRVLLHIVGHDVVGHDVIGRGAENARRRGPRVDR